MKTTEQAAPVRGFSNESPALRLLYSGDAGIVQRSPYYLREGANSIGRVLEDRGLLLSEDSQVSRLHATVYLEGGAVRIVDEQSRNGTSVNGQRVKQSPLVDGDIVRIGNSFLLLRSEPRAAIGSPDTVKSAAGAASKDALSALIGRAPAMRHLRSTIQLVAPTPAMVLLLGESGAGKELVARAIHELSQRQGPFVAINCSAIPDSLAESQLFGHVRGAFTGANAHSGYFRAAHGGTLFLDEVGELGRAVQPKLLRALEQKEVLPVGDVKPQPCEVRIVAATNRDLSFFVQEGSFRGDLLARLAEFTLRLPPLRERREDILLLTQRALEEPLPAAAVSASGVKLHPDLVERLLLYPWPYNVRELFKVIMELRIRSAGAPELGGALLEDRLLLNKPAPAAPPAPAPPPTPAPAAPPPSSGKEPQKRRPLPAREELQELLRKHHGVIADIAREVKRSRAQVYRWLKQHGLDRDAK